VLYPPALGLVKASAVLLLVRILPVVHSWKTPLRIFAGFIAVTESALLVCLFLQCRPLAYYWDKRIEDGSCFNQMAFYYADASLNMIIDFGILAAPCLIFRGRQPNSSLPPISKTSCIAYMTTSDLNVPRKQKYAVTALCSAGVFTLIASVVRLPYLHDLNQPGSDPTWQVVDIVIWSTAELGSAIMLSSVPAIKPVWVHAIEHCRRKMGVGGNSQDTTPSAGTGRTGLLKQSSVAPHPLSPRRISGGQGRDSYIHLNDNPGVMGRNHLDNDDHFTIDSRDRNEILQ